MPNNYRPISLLYCMEKVLERIRFKNIFNFPHDNDFISPLQSGFKPGDPTFNQLTFLYSFCKALDDGLEIRKVFFDISQAFDKVWHQGLLLKLKRAGIQGTFLTAFPSIYQIDAILWSFMVLNLTGLLSKEESLKARFRVLFYSLSISMILL